MPGSITADVGIDPRSGISLNGGVVLSPNELSEMGVDIVGLQNALARIMDSFRSAHDLDEKQAVVLELSTQGGQVPRPKSKYNW